MRPRQPQSPPRQWRISPVVKAATSALPAWLTARVIVLASLGVSAYLASHYRGVDPRLDRLHPGYFGWDAGWYEAIARRGYAALDTESLRFFPLFPLLGRLLAPVMGGSARAGLAVVANAAAFAAAVGVHRLVVLEKGDEAGASRAVWYLALFPAAFVLVVPYAEALFMALSTAAFLAARTRRWRWGWIPGLLAGLSRPLGAVLAAPMAIEAARGWTAAGWRDRLARAATVAAPLAGAGVYLAWVGARFGDPLLPVRVQQRPNLRGGLASPASTLAGAVRGLLSGDAVSAGLHLPWLGLFVFLVVVAFRRWPVSYATFAALTLVAAVSTSNLDSLERYCFSAFPFTLAIVSLVPERFHRPVLALAAAGLSTYALLAFLGPYIP